jgi:hypothetical protein
MADADAIGFASRLEPNPAAGAAAFVDAVRHSGSLRGYTKRHPKARRAH